MYGAILNLVKYTPDWKNVVAWEVKTMNDAGPNEFMGRTLLALQI